jgi:hypothetical protein
LSGDAEATGRRQQQIVHGHPGDRAAFNTGCRASCTVASSSCTASGSYWSSSSYASNPTGAWNVYFFDGEVFAGNTGNGYAVRGVRGGL